MDWIGVFLIDLSQLVNNLKKSTEFKTHLVKYNFGKPLVVCCKTGYFFLSKTWYWYDLIIIKFLFKKLFYCPILLRKHNNKILIYIFLQKYNIIYKNFVYKYHSSCVVTNVVHEVKTLQIEVVLWQYVIGKSSFNQH